MPGLRESGVVTIPREVQEKLEGIRREQHHGAHRWTEWQDDVIKRFWNDREYAKHELATEVLGVSYNTALKRARELGVSD